MKTILSRAFIAATFPIVVVGMIYIFLNSLGIPTNAGLTLLVLGIFVARVRMTEEDKEFPNYLDVIFLVAGILYLLLSDLGFWASAIAIVLIAIAFYAIYPNLIDGSAPL